MKDLRKVVPRHQVLRTNFHRGSKHRFAVTASDALKLKFIRRKFTAKNGNRISGLRFSYKIHFILMQQVSIVHNEYCSHVHSDQGHYFLHGTLQAL